MKSTIYHCTEFRNLRSGHRSKVACLVSLDPVQDRKAQQETYRPVTEQVDSCKFQAHIYNTCTRSKLAALSHTTTNTTTTTSSGFYVCIIGQCFQSESRSRSVLNSEHTECFENGFIKVGCNLGSSS